MMRGQFGGPMGGPRILMAPDVQKELGLSQEQIEKLGEILGRQPGGPPQGGPGGPPEGGFGGPPQGGPGGPPQGGPGGPPEGGFGGPPQGGPGGPPQGGFGGPADGGQEMEKRAAEMDAKIKGILNSAQFNRYHELVLQQRGPVALLEKQVGDKVGLSQAQREQILQVMEQNRMNMRPPQPGQQSDPEAMRKQMDAQKQANDAKILAVLTSEQRSKWQQMLGKPFTFARMQPRRGGEN